MAEGFPEGAEAAPKSDGESWLALMGPEYAALGDRETGYVDEEDSPVLVRDFHLLCSEHALPVFVGLEATPQDHPNYKTYLTAARNAFSRHFGSPEDVQQ